MTRIPDANPADELRAAAEKLRGRATAATPGPWTIAKVPPYTDPLLMSGYDETPDDGEVLIAGNVDVEPGDAAYIAAMHPGVGTALAAWLDETARTYDTSVTAAAEVFHDDPAGRDEYLAGLGAPSAHAMAIAHAINQQQEQT